MAEPNETANGDKAAAQESKIESKIESKAESADSELPNVESPPLSPAETLAEPVLDKQMKDAPPPEQPKPETETAAAKPVEPQPRLPRVKIPPLAMSAVKIPHVKIPTPRISRRTRHRAALAATVMLAAGFGAAVGVIAGRAPLQAPPQPQRDAALAQDNHALKQSVAKLTKDITALKTSIEIAARDSKTQLAKATDKLNNRIDRAVETTGSIGKQVAAPAPAPAAAIEQPPMPQPRPTIVQGWTVRQARNGRVLAEHRGAYFEVVPGVPLPGLGRVESIRREGTSLVVVTSKGLITASQSTAAIRPRPQYPPPYWRPY